MTPITLPRGPERAQAHLAELPEADDRARFFAQLRSLQEVKACWPRLRDSEPDPTVLLPAAVELLERFYWQYPTSPLDDLLRLCHDLGRDQPAIRERLPHLARLTGSDWLLAALDADAKATLSLDRLWTLIHAGRQRDAARLLGASNSVLADDDLAELAIAALAHPALAELAGAVVPLLLERKLVTPRLLEQCLAYLAYYGQTPTAQDAVLRYLERLALPAADNALLHCQRWLTPAAYRDFIRLSAAPVAHDDTADATRWDHQGHWRIPYPNWPLLEALPDDQQRLWCRQQLKRPEEHLDADESPLRSTMGLALHRLNRLAGGGLEAADLAALGAAWQATRTDPQTHWIADRAACLFTRLWPKVAQMDDALRATATDLFSEQMRAWLDAGGLSLPTRVKPLPGIDLDRLAQLWENDPDDWAAFWNGYRALAENDSQALPDAELPVNCSLPFHRLDADDDLAGLAGFLLTTTPPEEPGFRRRWRELLRALGKAQPRRFQFALGRLDEAQREASQAFIETED